MAGLLDIFGVSSGDPAKDAAINQGIMQAGLALMQARGRLGPALGQAGQAGMMGFQQAMQQDYQAKMQKAQLDEIARKKLMQDREESFIQGLPSPQQQANQTAYKASGAPLGTVAAAAAQPQVDPMQQLMHGAVKAGVMPLPAYLQSIAPKQPEYKTVGDALVQVGPGGSIKEAYRAAEKEPEALRTLGIIYGKGSPQYQKAAQDLATKMTTHQPATQVSVNTGQKGIENEMKLRDDFRAEPIYKAHAEVKSAYAQIQQGLKLESPAGDLAAATKVMKLLDPGSVVRESELGMAMAATGLMDRVTNYAKNIMSGNKLTPAQRKDFAKLADALHGESAKQYNSKRGEYAKFAGDWQLNGERVAGPEATAPTAPVINFGDLK